VVRRSAVVGVCAAAGLAALLLFQATTSEAVTPGLEPGSALLLGLGLLSLGPKRHG